MENLTGFSWEVIEYQSLGNDNHSEPNSRQHILVTERAQVPGGWLVRCRLYDFEKQFIGQAEPPSGTIELVGGIGIGSGIGITFLPNPNHDWLLPNTTGVNTK